MPQLPPSPTDQTEKTSLLGWWGIFPVAAWIVLEVVYSKGHADAGAIAPEIVGGFVLGRVLVGFLLAFVVSWIVYRIKGKSQYAGSVAFYSTIGVVALSAIALLSADQRKGASVATPRSSEWMSFSGFRFKSPDGWVPATPDKSRTKAMIVLQAANLRTPRGMLIVDVGKPVLPNAREMAQSFADKDGRVSPDPVSLDGESGILVETTSADLSRPRLVLVVFREGQVYLIMAAGTNATEVSSAFDAVLASWEWNDSP